MALLTKRFTLTPSRSPNLRRKSSTSLSMRIVRVTLLLGGNPLLPAGELLRRDRKSTRLNSSHGYISYAVFCLKKKKKNKVKYVVFNMNNIEPETNSA